MKKKIYNTGILLGMIAVLFLSATGRESSHETDNVKVALEIERDLNSEEGTETFESDVSEIEINELSARYGSYRVTEFWPTLAFLRRYDDYFMMPQEADMLLGRIIDIKPERLITYDVGKRSFVNYNMQRYVVENPKYSWTSMEPGDSDIILFELRRTVENDYFDQLEGVITAPLADIPNLSNGKHYFYAVADKDKLMMYSNVMTGGGFLLERCEEEPDDPLPEWSSQESLKLLQGVYGKYQVTEFLPTKFYPALDDVNGVAILPEEEASLMIGKTITMDEDLFVTYDNYRQLPRSETANRVDGGFWLDKIKIENPDYRVKNMRANEIYGIRDNMLPKELQQEEYVEVDVYPGYETNSEMNLPQMYLVNDGRIIMYAMGEYFLMEKMEDSNEEIPDNSEDLSEWVGRYAFLAESRKYEIEIKEKDLEEYYADVKIEEEEGKTNVEIKADICGNSERISFVFKEYLSGELEWQERESDIMLSFQRDADTGDIYTYWGALTKGKGYGGICFVKE